MATITTDTFLDGGVARTAGEAWTCNGARLTIRTDTRWHANAPASMTGTLGSLTISSTLGGGYTIDGRNVRWMPYNTGTGTVPAIGTTITQGGVSGYLLGVWASLTSAPTAVGAAMPASGFIKFREVTGGAFAAGALTGISASATGPDVVGWIEVVHDQAAAITVPRLGDFTVRGAWFDLGTTTGTANQLVQIPTNGSATAYVPGVWIATTATPTTDEDYEFYPSIFAGGFTSTNLSTDARSKFVCMETNGNIRIGHNGTGNIGFVPPAGRNIRIPNVLGRQCTTAARATNAIPNATAATRPDYVTTNAGVIDMEYFATDWYLSFAQAYSVKAHHVATFDYFYVSEIAAPLDFYDGGNGVSQSIDARSFNATSCFAGGTIEKWYSPRYASGTTDHAFEMISCIGQTLERVQSGIIQPRSSGRPWIINICNGLTFLNCRSYNGDMLLTTCKNIEIHDQDHVDMYLGGTTTSQAAYVVSCTIFCENILIDGVTFGLNGTITNCHPYGGVLFASQSSNIKLRNGGTRSAFLSGGSANNPAAIFVSGGNNSNIKIQRFYMLPTRTAITVPLNSDINMTYEHLYGDFADVLAVADLNAKVKNCGATNSTTGQASVYGTHFLDFFTSDTAGRLVLAMNENTTLTNPYITKVSGTPKFSSAGNVILAVVGDEIIFEQDYYTLGVTALANLTPTVTGTNVTFSSGSRWGNHDLYFQIDKGAGFNGSWLNLNATTLSLHNDIDPTVGFKLKIRAVCAIAATTNLLTYIRIDTVSSFAAQVANLYPLDVAEVELTGLVSGSEIRAYLGSDPSTASTLSSTESSGTTYTFTQSVSGQSGYIVIFALGYQPIILPIVYSASDTTIPVQQVIDRVYTNPS